MGSNIHIYIISLGVWVGMLALVLTLRVVVGLWLRRGGDE